MRPLRLLLALCAALFTAVSCVESSPFIPNIETANFAPSLNVDLAASTKTASGLYYRDLVVGAGTTVPDTGTKTVTTNYAGYLRSGSMFDDGTISFATGTGAVIAGYDEGVRGMKVGGTRQIIIPPALGYWNEPRTGIPAYSILVFTVTVTNVQ